MGRSSLWSTSWLRHQMFYTYITISATQARENDDLHRTISPFSPYLSSFSGVQRFLVYVRPQRIVALHPPKTGKRGPHLWAVFGGAFGLGRNWPSNEASKGRRPWIEAQQQSVSCVLPSYVFSFLLNVCLPLSAGIDSFLLCASPPLSHLSSSLLSLSLSSPVPRPLISVSVDVSLCSPCTPCQFVVCFVCFPSCLWSPWYALDFDFLFWSWTLLLVVLSFSLCCYFAFCPLLSSFCIWLPLFSFCKIKLVFCSHPLFFRHVYGLHLGPQLQPWQKTVKTINSGIVSVFENSPNMVS